MNIGLIGCGNISHAYLKNGKIFNKQMTFRACADLRPEAAKACAETYGLEAMSVDDLLADPSIDAILNLTTPQSHVSINLRAIEAGKHVHCEKPFGLDREGGRSVIQAAGAKGVRVGCAPDTFLGGGHQTCRKLIDDGLVGRVVSGTAFMLCHGHESWHPSPAFYYQKGGGPLFDMGPYYLTALVNLLGPVARVSAFTNRSTDLRKGIKANEGKTFPVEIDTHVAALLEFSSGAVITLITSFDVWKHSNLVDIELHGTEGSLHVPDPNCFDGDIRFFKAGLSADWAPADNPFIYNGNMRAIGLADLAAGVAKGRPHRCSGDLAFHVLDILCGICESAEERRSIALTTTCERPAPLPMGLVAGELD
ncbi:MAG: Gfo/Idh/MocA family protein [Kiritimatiellia bacterium]|jgi:predicted dehydrogenase